MDYETTIARLRKASDKSYLGGMQWFGINADKAIGVSIPKIRAIAKEIGTDQGLSLKLWKSDIYEARLLAGFVGDPKAVTEAQMDEWVNEMDSWGLTDGVCGGLFDRTPYAIKKIGEWSRRKEEYVRRSAFVLMAGLAVHDKKLDDRTFERFIPIIIRYSDDERNFVKKAVNWALRQIGKRNSRLNKIAVAAAGKLKESDSKSARWIGSDAYRELTSEAVRKRLRSRKA